jgi:hypothetical protein
MADYCPAVSGRVIPLVSEAGLGFSLTGRPNPSQKAKY